MSELRAQHTPAYPEADLATCDREPIHVPGAIQPHGVLVAIDDDARVVMVSRNVGRELGVEPDDALGLPLPDVLGEVLARRIAELELQAIEPLVALFHDLPPHAGYAGRTCDVRVHRSGERTVIEVEPVAIEALSPMRYSSARGAMARLGATTTVEELVEQLAREVREVLGFDRVMVYRFDEEWNGEVVAEERRPDLESFLGLHYPASDIPAQARRLYTENWIRLIADIGYEPVPLHPTFDPVDDRPLDLSHSTLRSVSPLHLEYLSNMGVTASLSISLVYDDKLWGLVACHHYSGPHRPSQDARGAAEFLGQVASQLVADRERADARERRLGAQSVLARMTARIAARSDSPLVSLMDDPELLTFVGASGAALSYDGELIVRGEVPDSSLLQRIASALEDPEEYATFTDRGGDLIPELRDVHCAAGVLRVGSASDRWLLWFRPEQELVVNWGGDPHGKERAEADGVRLSPRKSFEKWREVVRGRSLPWAPWKVEAADALGKYLISLLLTRSREQIAMAESLQRSVVLDRPPLLPGLEVAARYQPASSYQLGGDWWDAFELDDGQIALAVGDVAGHGVMAASAMTQVRTALRAYLFEGHGPAVCVDQLDRLMGGLMEHQVATAAVAVLDPRTWRLQVASAGHPLPLLVRDGSAEEVEVPIRPLLGVGTGRAESLELHLPADATLLLYTDGLIERRGTDLHHRTERLARLAAQTHGAQALAEWLDVLLAAHADVSDDTTLLAIRRE